jgi:hypothetical protein
MKNSNQFACDVVDQRVQEKMLDTGRGPENEKKNPEDFETKQKPERCGGRR